MDDTTWVILLRGINVGGHRKVPMADLRDLATGLDFLDVRTYLNSGNLIGRKQSEAAAVREELEQSLEERFGFAVEVVVRTAAEIVDVAEQDPFPEAAAERANLVHVVFGVSRPTEETLNALGDYLSDKERAELAADHLWIDYAGGSARSKVSHDVLKRAFDAIVTSRNLKTVRRLSEMVQADMS